VLAASDPDTYSMFAGVPAAAKGPDLGKQPDRFPVNRNADQLSKVI
jgi:hypothetical protein